MSNKNKTLLQAGAILAAVVVGMILLGMVLSTGYMPPWYLM